MVEAVYRACIESRGFELHAQGRCRMHHEIQREMGGWMTLAAAQGYMALTPAEQFSYTMSLVRSKKRLSALSEREARLALGAAVQPLSL